MRTLMLLTCVLCLTLSPLPAFAADKAAPAGDDWLTIVQEAASQPTEPGTGGPVEVGAAAPAWEKPIPLSVAVEYALVSDYIFRGINFSEYQGEGREDLNHQLTATLKYDLKDFGKVGATFWFEWFAGQDSITPGEDDLQEVDYALFYQYTYAPIATTFETGFIAYTFPPFAGDFHTDYEWYIKASFDDSKLWGTDGPVLNPYVAYYQDLDLAENASWWEVGISHDFALANMGCGDTPILKDIVITPSAILGVQHRYYGELGLEPTPDTQLANLLYGLQVKYNLGTALGMPAKFGNIYIAGFLGYSEAFDREVINDEFFGGLRVGWEW